MVSVGGSLTGQKSHTFQMASAMRTAASRASCVAATGVAGLAAVEAALGVVAPAGLAAVGSVAAGCPLGVIYSCCAGSITCCLSCFAPLV